MYSLPASYCLRHFVRLIPPRIQWLVPDFKNTTRYLHLVFMFFMEQKHRFFFPNKKRFLKKFNSRRIQPFFIFLNYSTQIIVMKCGETQGWFLDDIFAAVAVLYLEYFNAKGLKLFRRKSDAMHLIRKKILTFLILKLVSTLSSSML